MFFDQIMIHERDLVWFHFHFTSVQLIHYTNSILWWRWTESLINVVALMPQLHHHNCTLFIIVSAIQTCAFMLHGSMVLVSSTSTNTTAKSKRDGICSYLGEISVPHKVMKVYVRQVQSHWGRVWLELPEKSEERDQEQLHREQNVSNAFKYY